MIFYKFYFDLQTNNEPTIIPYITKITAQLGYIYSIEDKDERKIGGVGAPLSCP